MCIDSVYIYRTYLLFVLTQKRYHDVPLIRFMTTDWTSQAPSQLTFSSSQVSEATEGALSPGVEPQLPLRYNFIRKHLLNQPGSSSAAISWHFESATCNKKGRSYTIPDGRNAPCETWGRLNCIQAWSCLGHRFLQNETSTSHPKRAQEGHKTRAPRVFFQENSVPHPVLTIMLL